MGLDLVELVIEVEEAFDIRIADADATQMATVGQLHDYIVERYSARPRGCVSAHCFYQLRSVLIADLGVAKRVLAPQTSLKLVIPLGRRRHVWDALRHSTRLHLPQLRLQPPLSGLLSLVMFLAAFGAAVATAPRLGLMSVAVFFGIWASSTIAAFALTLPLAVALPAEVETLGQLTRATVVRNYPALSRGLRCSQREEIWEVLRAIVVEQLHVKPEDVRPESRWVQDLGAD